MGGEYPRAGGGPSDGGGYGGYGGYAGNAGAEGVAPRERRGGPGRQGGTFAKQQGKRGRRGQKPRGKFRGEGGGPGSSPAGPGHAGHAHAAPSHFQGELVDITGVLELEKGGTGYLRQAARNFHRLPDDTFVPHQTIHRYGLRDGSFIEGRQTPSAGPGKKPILREVILVDGMDPQEAKHLPHFKRLVSVDPDFQYRLGEVPIETGMEQGDTALRIMDMLMPLGRGQRALIVAPPRGGKTVLMQKMAKAIELKYPDVHLMVMLIDERPEEGTHWKRSVKGEVYVSTADESAKDHIQTAEGVWRRACRLCECGQEVVLLLDSITRLARAYNQEIGNSGRILSGGIDSRTMERPKKIFGSARNTEDGGSLTIIGTCLVDTGSKMDQVIFEEFKGTGNMEINLSRMLAEKRIFPAFDLAGSGTRKEERLLERSELMKVSLLRRVLNKMRPMEAMELLVKKLEQYPTNRDFLEQFNLVNYQ
jgi:transcription termination factor Rho